VSGRNASTRILRRGERAVVWGDGAKALSFAHLVDAGDPSPVAADIDPG
jgi:hypothetical protein